MAKISLDLIQQLRERTGVGMLDCKNALTETNGDMEKAIEILRKKGSAVAAKRSSNIASEGLVHAYIHPGSRIGVMVEINCETDFVARTDIIKQFAADLCLHIAAIKPLYLTSNEVDATFLEKERRFFSEQLIESGKPEKIVAQIVEGKIAKVYSEICLLQQPFVKNDQLTVEQALNEIVGKLGEKIVIRRFSRFEIGTYL